MNVEYKSTDLILVYYFLSVWIYGNQREIGGRIPAAFMACLVRWRLLLVAVYRLPVAEYADKNYFCMFLKVRVTVIVKYLQSEHIVLHFFASNYVKNVCHCQNRKFVLVPSDLW